ncbi:hypothetical protein DS745_02810 [Anaerobacillus alkaliphilus]|uniref:Uncharacterized protein n=1 Tax=Anaerobacillus alkaliphilus TaxID=1548597 RepID=A0A4Q0VY40_9BACI|nr:DUF6232 family protein [Anaerobacillus alkaliphilus]RXJ04332.1 hypothetical protein DS745_02810 [Anaerobacillus alkaliphilus]
MSDVIYFESEDGKIVVADDFVQIAHVTVKVNDLMSGEAYVGKPDQTINMALALVGIFCIFLGKIREGQLTDLIDINVLFTASNYFDLAGLIILLVTLLITLPQKEYYALQFRLKDGNKKRVILKDKQHYVNILEINKAINQALRYADYRRQSK